MTMAITLDEIQALKSARAQLEEIPTSNRKGVEAALEIAQESGAVKLIKSATELSEMEPAFRQSAVELIDGMGEFITHYEKVGEGLGNL